MEIERDGGGADRFGKSDDFFDRLTLHVQRYQQRRNLRVRALAAEDLGHHRVRLFAGERLTVIGDAMEGVENHKIQATGETRLFSNRARVAVIFSTVHVCQTCSKPHAPTFGQELDIQRSLQGLTIG